MSENHTTRPGPERSWAPSEASPLARSRADAAQIHEAGASIEAEGEPKSILRLLVSGWAARVRHLADGRRQIVRLLIPGDLCCVPVVAGLPSPCATVAVTRAKTATLGSAASRQALAAMNEELAQFV